MFSILSYVDRKAKKIFIADFKKYYDLVDESQKKFLSYKNIKKLVRKSDLSTGIYSIDITTKGLRIGHFCEEYCYGVDTSIHFKDAIEISYITMTPLLNMLYEIFEMSGMSIVKNKVEDIDGTDFTFGILEGKFIYSNDKGHSIINELQKTMKTFFVEGSFNNVYSLRF